MKYYRILAIVMATSLSATTFAETKTEENTAAPETTHQGDASKLNMDNGVIPIADDRGFTLQSNDGSFVFKPYLYMQSTLSYRYYDDEGLDKAYNQDNVANSGFAMPYAIIGFTGKAFGKIDYNVCVNAAASGGNILQQAWLSDDPGRDTLLQPANLAYRASHPPLFSERRYPWYRHRL